MPQGGKLFFHQSPLELLLLLPHAMLQATLVYMGTGKGAAPSLADARGHKQKNKWIFEKK